MTGGDDFFPRAAGVGLARGISSPGQGFLPLPSTSLLGCTSPHSGSKTGCMDCPCRSVPLPGDTEGSSAATHNSFPSEALSFLSLQEKERLEPATLP